MSSKNKSLFFNTSVISEEQLIAVIKKARLKTFPLHAFPEPVVKWLEALAFSVNTKPEFVLISAISVVSTLMGPQSKLIIRPSYSEPCNLFTVCLSEPGAGKSQAFELAVERPIRKLPDPADSVIVNDFTRKGLFQHLVAHEGRALIAHSEMSSFYELILKRQQEGSGERQLFCRLYDGVAEWSLTSAGTGSTVKDGKKRECREVLTGNALAFGGFTQPEPFLQLFKPLAKTKDGFLDRILMCSIKPHLLHEEEVETYCEVLNQYKTKSFEAIYQAIYEMHRNGRAYTYSKDANTAYAIYSNNLSDKMNEQWEQDSISINNFSKDRRNLIRLSCVLHVLISVLRHFIEADTLPVDCNNDSVPLEVSMETLRIAEEVVKYFSEQREAFLMILNPVEKTTGKPKRGEEDVTSRESQAQSQKDLSVVEATDIINSFGQWFIGKAQCLTSDGVRKIATEKKPRESIGTFFCFRKGGDTSDGYFPFDRATLSAAAAKLGGNGNDTAYFIKKERCISIPMAVFLPAVKEKIVQVVQNSRKRTSTQLDAANDGPSSNGEPEKPNVAFEDRETKQDEKACHDEPDEQTGMEDQSLGEDENQKQGLHEAQSSVPLLDLTGEDISIISSGKRLTDKHINAAQKLIAKEFPLIAGLQDTVLSQKDKFISVPLGTKAIQIHHVRYNHWITSSSIAGYVEVFDSIYSDLCPDTEVQLSKIYQRLADNVADVKIVPCQYQKGSKDCGLYAIAWAYELANGNRPECIAFEQTRMRAHLMACFEKRKMSHFPLTNEGKQPRRGNSTT